MLWRANKKYVRTEVVVVVVEVDVVDVVVVEAVEVAVAVWVVVNVDDVLSLVELIAFEEEFCDAVDRLNSSDVLKFSILMIFGMFSQISEYVLSPLVTVTVDKLVVVLSNWFSVGALLVEVVCTWDEISVNGNVEVEFKIFSSLIEPSFESRSNKCH
jgi:hypothetical protein